MPLCDECDGTCMIAHEQFGIPRDEYHGMLEETVVDLAVREILRRAAIRVVDNLSMMGLIPTKRRDGDEMEG